MTNMKLTNIIILCLSLFLTACTTAQQKGGNGEGELVNANLARADLNYQGKQYEDALKEYKALAAKDNSNSYVLFKIANIHSHLGQYDEAVAAYKAVIALDKTHSKAWHNLAVVYMKEGAGTWQQMKKNVDPKDPLYKSAKYYNQGMRDLINKKY